MKLIKSLQLAEEQAFQRGFDRGLAFARQEGMAKDLAIRDTMIFDFLKCKYDLGSAGKRQASVLYEEFSAWWAESGRGANVPTFTDFGKKLGRVLHKSKVNGCIFYKGLTLKHGDS